MLVSRPNNKLEGPLAEMQRGDDWRVDAGSARKPEVEFSSKLHVHNTRYYILQDVLHCINCLVETS